MAINKSPTSQTSPAYVPAVPIRYVQPAEYFLASVEPSGILDGEFKTPLNTIASFAAKPEEIALSTYCFVAAYKLLEGSPASVKDPVIVPPAMGSAGTV